ncbi:hypothetical protein SADUNF_Sadunf01G0041300 [Salix dunnii]|uniref:Dirigent protein n=1 Tax=Salix dunnii TaxID=1413687 RepID=A0A835TJ37_9ROSI|nr:hypothetical protein SADUNF_Sadunf01G0041300 [Salix dunnii]
MFKEPSTAPILLALLISLAHAAPICAAVDPVAATGEEPILELYMHDILGGSNPTARPITGLLGNIYSGQVPFARPIGFVPPKGVAIPNANGAIPSVNGINGIPLGTGLAGTTFAGNQNLNGNPPTQLGPDGLGLGFGTITVIDDILTSSPELGSQSVGKAQGVYVASSGDGSTQMMAFTALFEGGEYGDSLNFNGIYKIGSTMSRLSVTGGTGKFKNARGFAEVRSLIPSGQHFIDGAETLLRFTMFKLSSPCIFTVVLIATLHVVPYEAAIDPAPAGEPALELFMHDILGGSNPTARPITGLLGNIYSGQVPFARPVGFIPPNGVVIPNANGALPTVNGLTGIPLGTGLSGTTFAGQNPNGQIQTQLGPDGLGLGFGTITVIDDVLTTSPELGSQQLGKAQGVYVASSADGTTQMMAFTAMFEGGEFGDALNFYGIYKISSAMSRLSVTGGTGKFKNAIGFAEIRGLIPSGQVGIDGAQTLLRITVHLKY